MKGVSIVASTQDFYGAVLAAVSSRPSLAERGLGDGVGGLYVEHHRRSELLLTGGHRVDVSELLRTAL